MKKTSIILLILTLFMILSTICVQADIRTTTASGTFNGYWGDSFEWTLYSDGELCITGEGILTCNPNASTTNGSLYPWYTYKSTTKSITLGEGITTVGAYAFDGSYATSVSLPGSLGSIGQYAFRGSNLNSVRTPAKTTSIGKFSFLNCKKLTNVEMTNVTSINESAFENCIELKTITVAATSISTEAFYNCNTLHTITFSAIPSSVATNAFTYCNKLSTVNFVGTETQWNSISSGNTKLTNATVNYVKSLSFDANGGEFGVIPVVGPSGSDVTIPSTAPIRSGYTFYGWGTYKYDTFVTYQSGDSFTLSDNSTLYAVWEMPDGVKAKGKHPNTDMSWVLYYDGSLVISGTGSVYGDNSSDTEGYKHYRDDIKNVIVNEGITGIGNNAFYAAPVQSITLPTTLDTIKGNAFSYTSIKTINIPSSVNTIGSGILMGSLIEAINLGNPSHDISAIFTTCADMQQLNAITVDENNSLYTVENGVLYDKEKTTVIRIPTTFSGQLVLPDTITTVCNYAFSDVHNIESIVFPRSLEKIGDRIFNFADCPVIYYKGTEEEWKNVNISTVWNVINPTEYEYGKIYNITYNANGGENAPAASEKVKGTDIVLSDVTPTRAGYEFLGWATTKNATVAEYQPKDTYTTDSDLTLYAVWDMKLPDVTFTKNARLWTFDIKLENHIDNHTAYAVIYDKDGKMLNYDFYKIKNASSYLLLTPDSNATEAKIFVWGDDTNKPYTKAYPISLQQ